VATPPPTATITPPPPPRSFSADLLQQGLSILPSMIEEEGDSCSKRQSRAAREGRAQYTHRSPCISSNFSALPLRIVYLASLHSHGGGASLHSVCMLSTSRVYAVLSIFLSFSSSYQYEVALVVAFAAGWLATNATCLLAYSAGTNSAELSLLYTEI